MSKMLLTMENGHARPWLADCMSQAMPNQTPLLDKNDVRPDLKVRIAPPSLPRSCDLPPGAHTEAQNLLLRFNPQLVGFGIATPSDNLCPGMRAPSQACVVETIREKNSEDQQ
jgi:hypothetical protein